MNWEAAWSAAGIAVYLFIAVNLAAKGIADMMNDEGGRVMAVAGGLMVLGFIMFLAGTLD